MSAGIFSTPRPLPSRLAPAIAGGSVIVLALPVFAVAGWPLSGWALAAVLWAAAEAFAFVLARLPTARITSPRQGCVASAQPLARCSSAFRSSRSTVADEGVGIAAAGLYALAFTVELGVGLAQYFAGEAKA